MMKIKKGFTLAEVMIVMAVMGVLAAIAIPAVMNISPDTNRVMFKKAYSTLEKTIEDLINSDTAYPATETGMTTDGTNVEVPRGFNYNLRQGTTVPANRDKFCYLLSQNLNTVGDVICPTTGAASFTTTDGITWRMNTNVTAGIEFPLAAEGWFFIDMDVNGGKEPNCYDSNSAQTPSINVVCPSSNKKTVDTYRIGVRYDGKIQTFGNVANEILTSPTENKKSTTTTGAGT